jgi:hypothetical protein
LRESALTTWDPVGQAGPVAGVPGSNDQQFTYRAVFDTPGSFRFRVRNPDGKYSGELSLTVQAPQAPPLVVTCPTVAPTPSPDAQPVVVTFPGPIPAGGTPPYAPAVSTPASGSPFPVGTTTVTSSVADSAGQKATCTFSVVVTPPPTQPPQGNACASGSVSLSADVVLTGQQALLWEGTAANPCQVDGNGHRLIVGPLAGSLTIRRAAVTELGTATANAIGGAEPWGYAMLDGGQVTVEDSTIDRSGRLNFYTMNGATIAFRRNTVTATQAFETDETATTAWLTEQGGSTAPKYFQNNKVFQDALDVGSPNWTVGGSPTTGNIFIGKRAGLAMRSQVSGVASYNYSHSLLDVTPQQTYWSQVSNLGIVGAGVTVQHNVFLAGHWVGQVVDGLVDDNVFGHAHGHEFLRLGIGGRFHRNILTTSYPAVASYPRGVIPVASFVGLHRETDELTFDATLLDARGPDAAPKNFVVIPGATLTETNTKRVNSSDDPTVNGPLPIGSGQSGNVSIHQAGFPFNDADILNGTYTVPALLDYFRWVFAPPGAGTAPAIATTNKRPAVYAGPSFQTTETMPRLNGYCADDALPAKALTCSWSQVSGPGSVTFSALTKPISDVTASAPGAYVLRLTATDGALSSTSEATITFGSVIPIPTPPSAQAHPRLWLTPALKADLLAKRAANDPDWQAIQTEADKLLLLGIPTTFTLDYQPGVIGYGQTGSGWLDAFNQLGLVYQLTGDARYAVKALALLDFINTIGGIEPVRLDSGRGSMGATLGLAIGFDWFYDRLSPAQKAASSETLNRWNTWTLGNAYAINDPTSNYWQGHQTAFAASGYATLGDNPEAKTWVDRADQRWADWAAKVFAPPLPGVAPAGAGPTGLFYGGLAVSGFNYGGNDIARHIKYMLLVRSATGVDLFATTDYAQRWARTLTHSLKPNRWQAPTWGQWTGDWYGVMTPNASLFLAAGLDGTTEGAWMQWFYEHSGTKSGTLPPGYAPIATPSVQDRLLWYKATRPQIDYRATAATHLFADGGEGVVFWRSGWGDAADYAWARVTPSSYTGSHPKLAGHVDLTRGPDNLLVLSNYWKGTGNGEVGWPSFSVMAASHASTLYFWDGGTPTGAKCFTQDEIYDGCQTGFGQYRQPKTTLAADYAYAENDYASAYDYAQVPSQRTLQSFVRVFVALGDGQYIVWDRIQSTSAGHTKQLRWQLSSASTPTLFGNQVTSTVGASKLTLTTLLPPGAQTVLVRNLKGTTPLNWHAAVTDGNPEPTYAGLTVLSTGPATATAPPATLLVTPMDFAGVQIAGDAPKVAVLPRTSTPAAGITVTTSHAGTARYLVAGLSPGAYQVSRNGTQVAAGAADGNGVFSFTAPSGTLVIAP